MSNLVDWEPDSDYETLKTNMANKVDWWGNNDIENMTVEDATELNEKAKLTCGWEITTESEE